MSSPLAGSRAKISLTKMEENFSCLYADEGRVRYNPCETEEKAAKAAFRECNRRSQLAVMLAKRRVAVRQQEIAEKELKAERKRIRDVREKKAPTQEEKDRRAKLDAKYEKLAKSEAEREVTVWLESEIRDKYLLDTALSILRTDAWLRKRDKNVGAHRILLIDVETAARALDQVELLCNNFPVEVRFFDIKPWKDQDRGVKRVMGRKWAVSGQTSALNKTKHARFVLSAEATALISDLGITTAAPREIIIITEAEYGYELASALILLRADFLRDNHLPVVEAGKLAAETVTMVNPRFHHAGTVLLKKHRSGPRFAEISKMMTVIESVAAESRLATLTLPNSCIFLPAVRAKIENEQLSSRHGTPVDFAIAAKAQHDFALSMRTRDYWEGYWKERRQHADLVPREDVDLMAEKMRQLLGLEAASAIERTGDFLGAKRRKEPPDMPMEEYADEPMEEYADESTEEPMEEDEAGFAV